MKPFPTILLRPEIYKNWNMDIKKRAPLSPTFVNLKSNTMKNTMQRYDFSGILQ